MIKRDLPPCRCLACRLPYEPELAPYPVLGEYAFIVDGGVQPAAVRLTEHGRIAVPYDQPRTYRGQPSRKP